MFITCAMYNIYMLHVQAYNVGQVIFKKNHAEAIGPIIGLKRVSDDINFNIKSTSTDQRHCQTPDTLIAENRTVINVMLKLCYDNVTIML